MIQRHIRRVEPDWPSWRVRQAAQQAFDSYARYWIESLRLPTLSARAVERGIDVPDYSRITDGLATGQRGDPRPARTSVAGSGPGAGWPTQGTRVTVVVERVDPPELFEWFASLCGPSLGMTVVPLGPDAGKAILRALGRNDIVCLLSDRDIGGGGVEVELFGERTRLPAGPATLAFRTGAPLLPVAVYFTPKVDGHLGVVRPPLAVERRGSAARGRGPDHPGPCRRARAPHPPGARAVAPVPAELALRPWICGSTWTFVDLRRWRCAGKCTKNLSRARGQRASVSFDRQGDRCHAPTTSCSSTLVRSARVSVGLRRYSAQPMHGKPLL